MIASGFVIILLSTYILGLLLQLLIGFPPGDYGRWLGAGTFALNVVGAIRGYETILGQDVHGNRFYCKSRERERETLGEGESVSERENELLVRQ